MCVYMILQAPKTCCQTALEEEKKRAEWCRKRVKQVNRKRKGKRKRWQRANDSVKGGNREGRQRKRERRRIPAWWNQYNEVEYSTIAPAPDERSSEAGLMLPPTLPSLPP